MQILTREHISYWGLNIKATVKELSNILGNPEFENNEGEPTTNNYVWHGILLGEETDEQALLYDVYDYLSIVKFNENEMVEWRINSDGAFNGLKIKDFLIEKLTKLRNGKD